MATVTGRETGAVIETATGALALEVVGIVIGIDGRLARTAMAGGAGGAPTGRTEPTAATFALRGSGACATALSDSVNTVKVIV